MAFTWPWEQPFQADASAVQPMPFIPSQELPTDITPTPLPFNPAEAPAEPMLLNAPQPQLSGVVNPSPITNTPPASSEEFQARKAGWSQIFDKIQTDPQARMITMLVGQRLLQGRKPGQSTLGGIADAAMVGMSASSMMDANQREQEMKMKEFGLKEAESKARVASSNAQTKKTNQDIEFDAQEQPTKLEKARSDAKTAALKLKAAGLEAKVQEAIDRGDPDGEKRAKQALAKVQSEITRNTAAAAASNAAARANNAITEDRTTETAARKVLANPKSTAEEVAAAERSLAAGQRGRGGSSAQVMNRADLAKHYANILGKEVTSPEVSKAVVDHERTAKKKDLEAEYEKYLSESGLPEETAWQNFRKRKARFGVNVDEFMGSENTEQKKSAVNPTGNWTVKEKK